MSEIIVPAIDVVYAADGNSMPMNGDLLHTPVKESKPRYPRPPRFEDPYEQREYLKGRLALAFRIFAKLGFEEGVVGHITLRDSVWPDHFWINPFGTAFSLITTSSLIVRALSQA